MQLKSYLSLFLLCSLIQLSAQPNLQPSIGIGDLPADTEPICTIPNYLGNYDNSGLPAGDYGYDFNLYGLNGDAFHLEDLLLAGKPVLMVNGSYTCPVFRGKIPLINQIASDYEDWIEVVIVYTVEAHPYGDISPYFGFENPGNANLQEGILYPQPTTYGERKTIVSEMLTALDIEVPVYIDGPCNNWWENFGPAPNNAYLVDVDGNIYSKHGWFNKFPNDIICDLDNLLGIPNNCDLSTNGSFTFELTGDSLAEGTPGEILYVYGLLRNNTNAGVEVEVKRLEENVPSGWETSICMDVCYPTEVSSLTIYLEAGEQLPYTMYFYTNEIPGDGMVRMGFRNLNAPQNKFMQRMYASTATTAVAQNEITDIKLFPNPTKGIIYWNENEEMLLYNQLYLTLFNLDGKVVKRLDLSQTKNQVDVSGLAKGVYGFTLGNGNILLSQGKIVLLEYK